MDGSDRRKSLEGGAENGVTRSVARVKEENWRNSLELELINEKYEMEKVIRRPSAIPKSPTITSAEFDEYADLFESMPLTDETTCGIWFFKGALLQKMANKKMYVVLYGLLGCFTGATYAYFNGTITTLEKRFQISSRTTGTSDAVLVTIMNYFCSLQVSLQSEVKSVKYLRQFF